jgi:hypothetical protein
MIYQILHNPELAKLDLSGLVSATSGAARLPPELRVAFGRRAKKLPYLYEGKALLRRQWAHTYDSIVGYGLSECVWHFLQRLSVHHAKQVYLRRLRVLCAPFLACMGAALILYAA